MHKLVLLIRLLGKCLWRFGGNEETHLRRLVIALKYGLDGGGWTMKPVR